MKHRNDHQMSAAVNAALARRMALPQTASLALSGPLIIPETDGGRAWFTTYDEDWELIQVRMTANSFLDF